MALGKSLPNQLLKSPSVVVALILEPRGLLWASCTGVGRARTRKVYGPLPCPQLCSQMFAMEWGVTVGGAL